MNGAASISIEIRVEWSDCDALGIVYYPHFYRWFDTCTHALMRRQDMDQRQVQERFGSLGYGLVDTQATFLAPARYFDQLTCISEITHWSRSTFRVEHEVLRGETKICSGHELRCWFMPDETRESGIRAGIIPDEFKDAFS
ncbi:MAG: acyl-CoA thioesterase [Hyphomicrobiales bacterium]